MVKKLILWVILLLMVFLFIKPNYSISDESRQVGYDLGYKIGRIHQLSGERYDPYGSLQKHVSEYYSYSPKYNRRRLEQGFIDGYKDGYYQKSLGNIPPIGVFFIIVSLILVVVVVLTAIKEQQGKVYPTSLRSGENGCVTGCFSWVLIFMLLINIGRMEQGWAFVIAFVDAICLGYLARFVPYPG